MIQVFDKQIRDSLDELIDPSTTALLVIDMQVGGVSQGGAIGDSDHDLSMMPSVVAKCATAIAAARAAGVSVIHVRVANLPAGASSPPGWLHALKMQSNGRPIDVTRLSIEGDPHTDFCPECMPLADEFVLTKRRPSAFFGTDLAMLLRAQRIESVAIVGISTAGCVESTLRDATHHDFYAVLIEDAVGAYDRYVHDAAMIVMRARHNICTLDAAIAVWSSASPQFAVLRGRAGGPEVAQTPGQ